MYQINKRKEENEKDINVYTYDEAVEMTGHGRYNYLLLIACSIISNAVALDLFGFGIIVAAANCDLELGLTETGVLASAPFVGVLFAYPWGYYADTRGRRRALLLSTIVGFIFAAISSFSPNWQLMMLFKVTASIFSNASYTLTMTIVGECTGSRHRSKYLFILNSANLAAECVSFGVLELPTSNWHYRLRKKVTDGYRNNGDSLAYFLLPLQFSLPIPFLGIAYRPWRLFTLALALPLGVGGLMMAYLHESPKFLASRGDNMKALAVLQSIYEWNGGKKEDYQVHNLLTTDDTAAEQKISFWESIVKQTAPIFKPPLLWRTLPLFYLMAICCSTNNAFIMWYPTIVNIFFNSFSGAWNSDKMFCDRVFGENDTAMTQGLSHNTNYVCNDTISPNTIYSGILYGLFFCVVTLVVSKVASHRRLVLISWLLISGVSGTLVNLYQPAASLVFFVLFQTPAIAIPSLASYFVDLYPTACRGMVTSLGMMVARMCSLAGVNLVGAVITTNCSLTFYVWSVFVFSGIVVSLLLPTDKKMNNNK